MSDICKVCSVKFNNAREILQCCECKNVFHPSCTKVRSAENFRKLGARKSSWKCESCKSEGDSGKDGSESPTLPNFGNFEDCINSLKESLITAMNSKFDEVNDQLAAMSGSLGTMQAVINDLKGENDKLKRQYTKIQNENINLRNEINSLQQYTRRDNLEIGGFPETKNEDIYAIIEAIAKVIDVPFDRCHLSIAHRIPSAKGKARPIICKFISRINKIKWLAASKNKKQLHSTEINPLLPPSNIYINEHLTPFNKIILGRARELKRENKIAYVWVKESNIYIRVDQNSPAKRIIKEDDLKILCDVANSVNNE